MMNVVLFSQLPADRLVPSFVKNLKPHARAEMCLLMRERGMSVSEIAGVTGLRRSDVVNTLMQKHHFRLDDQGGESRPGDALDRRAEERRKRRTSGLTKSATRLLLYMAGREGELSLSEMMIADAIGINSHSARYALAALYEEGHIRRLRMSRGSKPAVWEVTPEGRAMAASLAAGKKEVGADG